MTNAMSWNDWLTLCIGLDITSLLATSWKMLASWCEVRVVSSSSTTSSLDIAATRISPSTEEASRARRDKWLSFKCSVKVMVMRTFWIWSAVRTVPIRCILWSRTRALDKMSAGMCASEVPPQISSCFNFRFFVRIILWKIFSICIGVNPPLYGSWKKPQIFPSLPEI